MEGGFEELRWIPHDGDVGGVHWKHLLHFGFVEAHVIAHDVEAHPRPVVLHLSAVEERGVEEVVAAARESKLQTVLFPKAEQDVQDGAASRFVGFHEHDVHLRSTAMLLSQTFTGAA